MTTGPFSVNYGGVELGPFASEKDMQRGVAQHEARCVTEGICPAHRTRLGLMPPGFCQTCRKVWLPEDQPTASRTALEKLQAAVQDFSNSLADDVTEVGFVQHALVVWEETRFDEDGDQVRSVIYAVTGTGGLAVSVGLAQMGLASLTSDLVP